VEEGAKQIATLDRGLEANTAILTRNNEVQEEAGRVATEKAEAEKEAAEKSAKASRNAAAAERERAKAIADRAAEATKAEQAEVKAAAEATSAYEKLKEKTAGVRISMLTGAERVRAELARELEEVNEVAAAYQEDGRIQAAAVDARLALEEQAAARISEIKKISRQRHSIKSSKNTRGFLPIYWKKRTSLSVSR
jgi:hypothetical protein